MTQSNTPSMQDAIRLRRQHLFVGRGTELDAFREQLSLAWDDPRRRYVLNVFGEGGVGKTTLLREFVRLAGHEKAAVALTDDDEMDAPAAMARLAAGFGDPPGDPFHAFNNRYRVYRQKREELEADPDAPMGLAGLFGRAAVRVGAKALRTAVPGSDLVLGLVEDPLAEQAGQWAEFVRRKLGNRDEAQLVLEPEVVLSPLFVQGLGALAAARPVALLFDTYERTAAHLDGWLRALLEGRHGPLPANLTLVIAGRHPLDANAWADLEGVTALLCLEPFTEDEARDYLTRRGVTNEPVIAVLLSLSGRLPLLLMILAGQSPDDPARVGDATGTAVERFLKWVDDPARRALALNGALPRRLNRDVAALLGGGDDAFDWLIANRLIEQRGGAAWIYHDIVREQMLRYKRQESPHEWTALHERLAAYYAAERDGLGLSWADGARNERWQAAAVEALYHRLCAHPDRELVDAVNDFVTALDNQWALAREWAEALESAGHDSERIELKEWSRTLFEGVQGRFGEALEATAVVATRLLNWPKLERRNLPIVLSYRGDVYRQMGRHDAALADYSRAIDLDSQDANRFAKRGRALLQFGRYDEALLDHTQAIELEPHDAGRYGERSRVYLSMARLEEALADCSRAVELEPPDAWHFAHRSRVYFRLERYDEALADYTYALQLEPNTAWFIFERGRAFLHVERYDEALADFTRALELEPNDVWLLERRGLILQKLDRYKEALADLDLAIELSPKYALAIARRGQVYQTLKRYDEALADFDRAIELDPKYAWAIASRGQVYQAQERYDAALADFDRAIELDPKVAWAIASRGQVYQALERYDAALADFDRAIELDPKVAWAIASRGQVYQALERYDAALADFDRAIELDPKVAWAIASRGETHQLLKHYDEALADFDRAIDLDPKVAWAIAHRGQVYQAQERYDEALADFDRAIDLDPKYAWAIAARGETYRLLGRYDAALADFDWAVRLDPQDWFLYQRAITRRVLDPASVWRDDLDRAVILAEATRQAEPADLRNLFNLAVYRVAQGDEAAAEALYREGLAAGPAAPILHEALRDLDDYLRLFPDDELAGRLRALLRGAGA